jgi:hypothetical protein
MVLHLTYLSRLLVKIDSAADLRCFIVISEEERSIINEVCTF